MFDRIARVYDLMNSVMTAGMHHRWRERAADLAAVGPGDRVLDVASGTGDLAVELARRVGPGGTVVGTDFSEGMLDLARRKSTAVTWEWANALELPYPDDGFDAATVGFGARNFSDLDRGLAEMARVVRPGGRVVVLEITTPQRPPLSTFFSVWFDRVVPGARQARRRPGRLRVPAELGQALPGPGAARGADGRRPGWPTSAGSSRRAGSSRSTSGRCGEQRRGGARPRRGRRRARAGADARGWSGAWRRSRRRTASCWPSTRARRSAPAASGCGRCSSSSPPASARSPTTTACCAPRSRWS